MAGQRGVPDLICIAHFSASSTTYRVSNTARVPEEAGRGQIACATAVGWVLRPLKKNERLREMKVFNASSGALKVLIGYLLEARFFEMCIYGPFDLYIRPRSHCVVIREKGLENEKLARMR
jgi:hypothetical protein